MIENSIYYVYMYNKHLNFHINTRDTSLNKVLNNSITPI